MYELDDSKNSSVTLERIESYLSKNSYLSNSNPIRGIWDRDEYYEFHLIADSLSQESDYCDKLSNVNKYSCRICNIHVPLVYSKEHNNSVKHKICLKIADLSLERTRLHVKHQNEVPNLRIQLTNTYFCGPCAAVIQKGNKAKHEESKSHAISVKHDELLNNLLLIYTDIDNVQIEESSDAEVDDKNDIIIETKHKDKNKKINTDFNKIENSELNNAGIDVKKDNAIEADLDCVGKVVTNNIASQSNSDEDISLKSYIKAFAGIYKGPPTHSLAVVKNCVEITALNGDKAIVPPDNLNGYMKFGDRVQCMLCRVLIEGNVELHQLTKMHINRVMSPIKDMHCIRQIDEWNHCVFCNELFFDAVLHTQIGKHNSKLEEFQGNVSSANKITVKKTETDNMTYCAPCNTYIHTHNFDSHKNGSKHKNNCKSDPQTASSTNKATEKSSHEAMHYHITKTANPSVTKCSVCKTTIHYKNINEHVKGSGHNVKFNELLSSNKIKLVDNDFRCEICAVYVSKFDIIKHVEGKNHVSLLKPPISYSTAVASTSKVVPSTDLKANNNYCTVCKVQIPGNGITIHKKGKSHKSKVLELVGSKNSEMKQTPVKVNGHSLMQKTDKPNSFLCIVCKVEVPTKPENVIEHVNGTNHIKNYNNLILSNKL